MEKGDRVINVAEQAQELTLLFDASMTPLLYQHSFLRNPSYTTNKTRLISIIAQCFALKTYLLLTHAAARLHSFRAYHTRTMQFFVVYCFVPGCKSISRGIHLTAITVDTKMCSLHFLPGDCDNKCHRNVKILNDVAIPSVFDWSNATLKKSANTLPTCSEEKASPGMQRKRG
ncbi:hypothetical protein LSAT2_032895 [Lamellibrachia satsuma]|nr:hypothetical protein LSAT2_032895 [Lamellibrachia satsuma]